MTAITDAIRDVITSADQPLRYHDIAHHEEILNLVVEKDDVHRSLRDLIRAGEVEQTDDLAYQVVTDVPAPPTSAPPEYQEHAPTVEQLKRPCATSNPAPGRPGLNGLRAAIVEVIRRDQPAPLRWIMNRPDVAVQARNEKQVQNILYQLKRKGEIVLIENRGYVMPDFNGVTGPGEDEPNPGPDEEIPSPAPHTTEDAAPTADAIRDVLESAASAAQDALDAYIWSVGDPEKLRALMAARDATRDALRAVG